MWYFLKEKTKLYTGQKTVDPTNDVEKPVNLDETIYNFIHQYFVMLHYIVSYIYIYILYHCVQNYTLNESKNLLSNMVPQNLWTKKVECLH